MDHTKKLAFISNMTDKALQHVASTPNVMTPKGTMSHEKMLSFVTAMTKHGLEHFDSGGLALGGPTNNTSGGNTTAGGLGGGLGNFFGTNNQFQASGTPIQNGTNTAQLDTAYSGANDALRGQKAVTDSLNHGLFEATTNQDILAGKYLDQSNGAGPNPAQAALNQSTGQNIAQTAALMAGQRGAGGNAGAIAAQAAQQGAATQQQAVGQSATLQAQQQLAAEQNLQNLSASEVAQGTGATQALNNAQQNEQNILQGANTANNNANVGLQSNINNVNAGIATGNANSAGNVISGIGNSLSSVPLIGSLFAKGGTVGADKKTAQYKPWAKAPMMMAEGGVMGQSTSAPQSYVGQWLNSPVNPGTPLSVPVANIDQSGADPLGFMDKDKKSAKPAPQGQLSNGDVSAIAESAPELSTGAADLSTAGEAAGGAEGLGGLGLLALASKGGLMKKGGNVKPKNAGQKAEVSGDSLKNDKIPAMLSSGEIVIPRHITMSDRAPEKAAAFVRAQLAKRGSLK